MHSRPSQSHRHKENERNQNMSGVRDSGKMNSPTNSSPTMRERDEEAAKNRESLQKANQYDDKYTQGLEQRNNFEERRAVEARAAASK